MSRTPSVCSWSPRCRRRAVSRVARVRWPRDEFSSAHTFVAGSGLFLFLCSYCGFCQKRSSLAAVAVEAVRWAPFARAGVAGLGPRSRVRAHRRCGRSLLAAAAVRSVEGLESGGSVRPPATVLREQNVCRWGGRAWTHIGAASRTAPFAVDGDPRGRGRHVLDSIKREQLTRDGRGLGGCSYSEQNSSAPPPGAASGSPRDRRGSETASVVAGSHGRCAGGGCTLSRGAACRRPAAGHGLQLCV